MLCNADATLAQADSRLPGLSVLLDERRLRASLRMLAGLEQLSSLTIEELRYVPNAGCGAAVRAKLSGGGETLLTVNALSRRGLDQAWRRQKRWSECGKRRVDTAQRIDAEALLIMRPRHDQRVRALGRLRRSASRSRLLQKLLPELAVADIAELRLRPLHYRPQRAFIAGVDSRGGNGEHHSLGVLHAATAADFDRMRRTAQYASALGRAQVLGADEDLQVLATTGTPGKPLTIDASGLPSLSMMHALGRALAAVHDSSLLHPLLRRPVDDVRSLFRAVKGLDALAPALADDLPARARAVAGRLAQQLLALPWQPGMIHGDFSIASALAEDGVVYLGHWERAATGNALVDLGSLAAQLELHAIMIGGTAGAVENAFASFIDAWSAARGQQPDAAALRTYTAAGLLSLSGAAFRARDPRWPQRIAAIVHRSEQLCGTVR